MDRRAHQLDQYMCDNGFILMDLIDPAHWRRQGYIIHPHSANESPPYSKGQIMHGDYLYFRDPETLGDIPEALIKLALISMSLGYFDNALMILERTSAQQYISDRYGESAINIIDPASRKYGRKIFLKALYSQIRGLVPLMRYSRNALKS